MYQTPVLHRVGDAEEVILGVMPSGDDLDGNSVMPDNEYAGDEELVQIVVTTLSLFPIP